VWHLGPIPIRAYALCIITGIIVALTLTLRRYKARGGDPDMVWDAAIVAIPAGIIGGRTYHVVTDYDSYFGPGKDPWQVFNFSAGGLGIMGAVALGTLAVWALFRYRKVPLPPFADAVGPTIILAQAIGRLGNYFNQELYGRPTDVPWALDIFYRVDENGNFAPLTGRSTGELVTSVHPTFLYEMIWNVAAFAFLLWAERRFRLGHGRVFVLYIASYTLGRVFMETMRDDAANTIFGLRVNFVISAVIFIVSTTVFFLMRRGRETPDEVDPREPEDAGEKHEEHAASLDDADAADAERGEQKTSVGVREESQKQKP